MYYNTKINKFPIEIPFPKWIKFVMAYFSGKEMFYKIDVKSVKSDIQRKLWKVLYPKESTIVITL
jgi:hypothetical protein